MTGKNPRTVVLLTVLALSSAGITAAESPAGVAPAGSPPGSSASPAAPADWQAQAQKRIQQAEYEINWQSRSRIPGAPASWHAPNRAHDLRTYFTGPGIRVISRTEVTPSWEWGLQLNGYGRGSTIWPVQDPQLSPGGNRIDYDRGEIVEWYVNSHAGLEQGFTLSSRPEEAGKSFLRDDGSREAREVIPPAWPIRHGNDLAGPSGGLFDRVNSSGTRTTGSPSLDDAASG